MVSRVIQIDASDVPALERLGVRFKDVTARERHLKLTINRLKCDLAGDSARFFVVERRKFAQLSRVATAADALPLTALAKAAPAHGAALKLLRRELKNLARTQPRQRRPATKP